MQQLLHPGAGFPDSFGQRPIAASRFEEQSRMARGSLKTWCAAFGLVAGLAILPVRADDAAAFSTGSADPLVQYINEQVRVGWTDNEVTASDVADDTEWVRRVYLDLVGHIPPAGEADAFIKDKDPAKRSKLIDKLLEDRDYVQNMTSVWRNILIGRNPPDRTSQAGMEKFLRESFARNRPWNDIVFDLVSAEGHFEENGAANFLLSKLTGNPNAEDYHVEATAAATKIFLGMQVQCTQCHNHPFNDWKQNQFWEFNSFFRQVQRNDVDRYDPQTGEMVDDYSELVWREYSGPVYFETRQALIEVAYPRYFEKNIDPGSATERRSELAEVMCHEDPGQQLAPAFVNRTWGHFFGHGFTRPVDDMGPHNAASHPELLARLADEFVKSGYDVKQLVRWICNSESYNLTSQFNGSNKIDDPSMGEVPLFSHMYVKTMTMEQLYDSLLIATGADQAGAAGYEEAQRRRERLMADFLGIFGGNDNDEPTLFSGSIPQALLMMNGELVQEAVSAKPGSYLNTVLSASGGASDTVIMNRLYGAALGRNATAGEIRDLKKFMQGDKLAFYQDLYWSLLNSNEFIVNH
jgi:hypothetical protein